MEWNRFPVVEKPLAKIPLPPSSPPHGRSVCRTLPSRDSASSPPPTEGTSSTSAPRLGQLSPLFSRARPVSPTKTASSSSATVAGDETAMALVSSPMISSPVQPPSVECSTATALQVAPPATPVVPATNCAVMASTVPLPAILPATPSSATSAPTFAPTIIHSNASTMSAAQVAAMFLPVQPPTGAPLSVAARINAASGKPVEQLLVIGPADAMTLASPDASPSKQRRSRSRSAGDSKTKRKRKTPEQLSILEREFEANPMPNKDVRDHLSTHLGLTSRQVQIWFQNKRAKVKNARGGSGGPSSPSETSSSSPRSSPMLQPIGPSPPAMFPVDGFSDSQLFFDVIGGGATLPLFSLSSVPAGASQLHLNVEPTAFQNEYWRLKQAVDA